MEKLIPVINKLQDVFNTIGSDPLDLPQIVVVGSQSSGKSSVLEAIVGRDFLPRGSGIVTRRPLILQLINLPPNVNKHSEDTLEWGEFLHMPNQMFYDFDKIREEIERETDRLTGKNKGISDLPINLKIYSPHVLNLTLVDLPGITRVPIGDQPPDIERQIRQMIRQYIDRPNAIILAITAANTDLTNSDALQLARECDPEGERTLGVITKIDIMDKGTDALDMLLGRVVPLKLGFIGVVNRSQQDIIAKKSIRDALKTENDFFTSHSVYRNLSNRLGTAFLAKTLNRVLIQHIRDCLPELKLKVNKLLTDARQELLAYGDPLYDGKNSQGALLLQIITRFTSNYRDAIDGKLTELSIHELYGGARINYIFNEVFGRCLDSINPTEGLTTNDIRTAIRNATGPKAALFVPEASFELLVKGQIARLEEPSLQCVELVFDELQRIVAQLENKELLRFANLRESVIEAVNNLLNRNKTPTKDMISHLISIEMSFINTNHPDFVGGDGAITAILERMSKMQTANTAQPQQAPPRSTQPPALPPKGPSNAANGPGVASSQTGVAPQPVPGTSPSNIAALDAQQGFFSVFFGAPKPGNPNSLSNSNLNASLIQQQQQQQQLLQQQQQLQLQQQQQQGNSQGYSNSSSSTIPQTLPRNQGPPALMDRARSDSRGNLSSIPIRSERLEQVPTTIKPSAPLTDKESFETELIKYLLESYFNVVRKNIKDTVPKSIIHFLVNKSKETIQNELVSELYKEDLFDELLEESSVIMQRRESCKSMIDILKKAHDILNEVRDFQV